MLRIGRYRKAFTIVELLVVVSIISIFTLMSAPLIIKFSENIRIRTAAREVCTVMRTARRLAITRRQDVSVTVNFSNDRVTSYETSDPSKWKWHNVSEGVELADSSGDSNGSDLIMSFSPLGTCRTGIIRVVNKRSGKYFSLSARTTTGSFEIEGPL